MTPGTGRKRNVERFGRDVEEFGGYVYNDPARLSSHVANARLQAAIGSVESMEGRRVLDVGSGDGVHTIELLRYGPATVLGIEPAAAAVGRARELAAGRDNIAFEERSIYDLDPATEHYDVAVLRGVLHHLPDPERGVAAVCAVADEIIMIEPNGLNPGLKLLEKVSRYHREHEERSFPPARLDRWFEAQGGRVRSTVFFAIIPLICPDWITRLLLPFEPLVEALPVIRRFACGQVLKRVSVR